MPQWVMSRVPVAVALLSAIRSFVLPATVPASEVRAVSSILRLYSEGMGGLCLVPCAGEPLVGARVLCASCCYDDDVVF